jgi:hypothetical protein
MKYCLSINSNGKAGKAGEVPSITLEQIKKLIKELQKPNKGK